MPTPTWLDKVNFIRRFIASPCEVPWAVYFETGKKASTNLIVTLLSFGMDDIVRGFFKPKGLRSQRHGRKGRKGGPSKAAVPEIGEMIGQNVGGAEDMKGRSVQQGVKNLWIIDGAIQRGLYYWLIVDAVTTFAYDWLSGIAESPESTCFSAHGCREGFDIVRSPGAGGGGLMAYPTFHYDNPPIFVGQSGGTIESGSAFIAATAECWNDHLVPNLISMRLVRTDTPEWEILDESEAEFIAPFGTAGLAVSADINGPAIFQIHYSAAQPFIMTHGAIFAAGGD